MFLSLKKIIKDYNLNIKGVIRAHKGENFFHTNDYVLF